ncbi:MAG: HD domain-containing protein [Fretibacterium sp.]|nr:HD domain-containing protein [Fretibacterium sp.]
MKKAQNKERKRSSVLEVRQLPRDASFFLVGVASRFVQRKDKNGNPFWDISIMDETGQLDGKIWSSSEWWDIEGDGRTRLNALTDEKVLKLEGNSVGVQGKVVEFRDQNQYNFSVVYYVDQEKYPPHDFVRRSPIPLVEMEEDLRGLIAGLREPVRGFLNRIFFELGIWEEFRICPAAVSMHHAYVGGLLEHSLFVAKSARLMVRQYEALYPELKEEVVVAGALLHDLGKLETYRLSPAPQMTLPGTVVDHIVLGYRRFMNLAEQEELDPGLALEIGHILVSHHGSREFGSPTLPATPEAMIVAASDDLDFKLFFWKDQTSLLEAERSISDYNPILQRRFWRPDRTVSDEARTIS